MIALFGVALAQLADLVSWLPAITRDPSGELFPAGGIPLTNAIIGKAVAIAVMVLGLGALRLRQRVHPGLRRWRFRLAVLFVAWGVVGAATNVWGWFG